MKSSKSEKYIEISGRREFMASSLAIGLVPEESRGNAIVEKEASSEYYLANYDDLKSYRGKNNRVFVGILGDVKLGISGYFRVRFGDKDSAEITGILIVASDGRRWEREFFGAAMLSWFGAVPGGVVDSTKAIQAALDYGGEIYGEGVYLVKSKITLKKEGTFFSGPAASWGTETFKERALTLLASSEIDSDFILECKNPIRAPLRSIGLKNLGIDLSLCQAGGIAIYSAYDASEFRNINITGIPQDKIGFLAAPGRDNRSGVIQTAVFESIWAIKRKGISSAPAIKTWGIQESLFTNCKASHSSGINAAWELSSSAGVTLINPSFVNPMGYGLDIYSEKGVCDGITIITPTFESCLNTVRTRSKDSFLFGNINEIPMIGDVITQGSSVGTVWQSSALGVYVAMDSETNFSIGAIYNRNNRAIGNIKRIEKRTNRKITLLNPRVLGAATVGGAAGGKFSALTQSEVHLPDDSHPDYSHKYFVDDTVFENKFIQARYGQMTNPGNFNQVNGFAEPFYMYGDSWPWLNNIVSLESIPANVQRFTACKANQEAYIEIRDSTSNFTIDDYPLGSVLRIYRGSVTLRRISVKNFIIEQIQGNIVLVGLWRLAEYSFILNKTKSFTANSNEIMGATVVNTGASSTVEVTLQPINHGIDLGTRFTVRRTAAYTMRITPNAKDTIVGSGGLGKYIELASDGAFVTIEAVASNTYAIVASGGNFFYE